MLGALGFDYIEPPSCILVYLSGLRDFSRQHPAYGGTVSKEKNSTLVYTILGRYLVVGIMR